MKWRCQTPPCLVSTFEDIAVLEARSMPGFLCCTVCVAVEARCLLALSQIAFDDRQSFVVCYRCSRLSWCWAGVCHSYVAAAGLVAGAA